MPKIKFIYANNEFEINIGGNELISEALIKYSNNICKDINNLYFMYKGKYLSKDYKLEVKDLRNKNIIIFVFNLFKNKVETKKDLNNVICPKCKNLAFLNINNDSITISNCINRHIFNNLTIEDFIDNQYINESDIECILCKNKIYLYDTFYINNYGKYICPLCIKIIDKEMKIIDYKYRFSNCIIHGREFVSYCSNCNNKNLCEKCEEEDKKHSIILFKEIKKNKKSKITEIENKIKQGLTYINGYQNELKILNRLFEYSMFKTKNNINYLIKLYQKYLIFINNLKNYETINNLLNFSQIKLIKEIDDFYLSENVYNKVQYLLKNY